MGNGALFFIQWLLFYRCRALVLNIYLKSCMYQSFRIGHLSIYTEFPNSYKRVYPLESDVPWTVARASMIPFRAGLNCHRDDDSRDISVPRAATINSTPWSNGPRRRGPFKDLANSLGKAPRDRILSPKCLLDLIQRFPLRLRHEDEAYYRREECTSAEQKVGSEATLGQQYRGRKGH